MKFLRDNFALYLAGFICNFFVKIDSTSFIYPVTYDNKNNLVYIIHQRSIYDLNLWVWNSDDNSLQKALLSNFLPGGVKLIPGNMSFSFIDQGRLRIKDIHKRSPKTLDFFEPICDISIVQWIDEEHAYFSARKNKNFIICKTNVKNSNVDTIIEKEADCIYPQIISDKLFYIERTIDDQNFRTSKTTYKIIERNLGNNAELDMIKHNSNPIAFLRMISQNEGFYLEHPNIIDRNNKLINFTYHCLHKNNDNWCDNELFTFNLPVSYIFGTNDERLYESILPFLPNHHNDKIFFANSTKDKKSEINVYSYDLISKNIEKKTQSSEHQIFFSPVIAKDKCFYGFSSEDDIEIDESNSVDLLPFFKLCTE